MFKKIECPYCGAPLNVDDAECEESCELNKPEEIDSSDSAESWIVVILFFVLIGMIGYGVGKLLEAVDVINVFDEPAAECPALECPAPEPCAETNCPTFDSFEGDSETYLDGWLEVYTDMQSLRTLFTRIVYEETPLNGGYYADQCADIAERIREDEFTNLYNGIAGQFSYLYPPGPYNSSNPLMDSHARLLTAWAFIQKAVFEFQICDGDEGRYVNQHTEFAENYLRRSEEQLEFSETGYQQAIGR